MRTRLMATLATIAGTSLLLSGCDLFSSGSDEEPSPAPTAGAIEAPTPDVTPGADPAADENDQDATGDAEYSDDGAGTPPEGLDPNATYNYPDRPLGDTYILIGHDVYTTNDWAEATCTAVDGGFSFEAELVGPEHDTRSLFGQVGMTSEADLVAAYWIDLDGGFQAWSIQSEDITGHTVGTFHSLAADPDAGYVRGHGQFSLVVEHMMPATDPASIVDGQFDIRCGEVLGN